MRTHRIPSLVAVSLAALTGLGACASEDPWLRPRTEVRAPAAVAAADPAPAARFAPAHAAPAHVPQPAAAAPAPAVRDDDTLAALQRREVALADEYYAWREARQRNVALATCLTAFERSATPANRQRAESSLRAYAADPALQKFGGVAMRVSLASGSAPADLQQRLRIEERYLAERATTMLDARKANIALVTALQQMERDGGTAKSRATASKARAAYDSAMAQVR